MPVQVAVSVTDVVSETDSCPECGADELRHEPLLDHGGRYDITAGLTCDACNWSKRCSERCPDCGVTTLVSTDSDARDEEREAGIELAPGEHRRNIETRDVALNHLVGQRFRVGDAICRGDRLCEPCNHLQRITQDGVLQALTHRGGLRADILEDGTIRPGDVIEPLG